MNTMQLGMQCAYLPSTSYQNDATNNNPEVQVLILKTDKKSWALLALLSDPITWYKPKQQHSSCVSSTLLAQCGHTRHEGRSHNVVRPRAHTTVHRGVRQWFALARDFVNEFGVRDRVKGDSELQVSVGLNDSITKPCTRK